MSGFQRLFIGPPAVLLGFEMKVHVLLLQRGAPPASTIDALSDYSEETEAENIYIKNQICVPSDGYGNR